MCTHAAVRLWIVLICMRTYTYTYIHTGCNSCAMAAPVKCTHACIHTHIHVYIQVVAAMLWLRGISAFLMTIRVLRAFFAVVRYRLSLCNVCLSATFVWVQRLCECNICVSRSFLWWGHIYVFSVHDASQLFSCNDNKIILTHANLCGYSCVYAWAWFWLWIGTIDAGFLFAYTDIHAEPPVCTDI